ncbi:hypothetical protein [Streptomyces sp. NPDC060035]|uniref:hypothetical protein n=1 Tax=Streptomyces sp. NPDC060035 TaxID=3347044 RepID=UPI0036D1157C
MSAPSTDRSNCQWWESTAGAAGGVHAFVAGEPTQPLPLFYAECGQAESGAVRVRVGGIAVRRHEADEENGVGLVQLLPIDPDALEQGHLQRYGRGPSTAG